MPDLAIAPAPLQAAILSPPPLRPHPLDSDVSGGCCFTPLGGPYRRHHFSPDNPVADEAHPSPRTGSGPAQVTPAPGPCPRTGSGPVQLTSRTRALTLPASNQCAPRARPLLQQNSWPRVGRPPDPAAVPAETADRQAIHDAWLQSLE